MTKEENEIFTRVGPGTPMGELLRRYWWPVGLSADLKNKPTLIRLLCEDLVLFRDGQGRPGIVGAQCSHRRANLCLGNVTKDGLRCRYHGWMYDINGQLLDVPGEPPNTVLKQNVHHLSYPAEELGGFVFAYLGPKPAPLLPRFDFLAGEGEHHAKITGFANCNWFQIMDNVMDPYHVSFTHAPTWTDLETVPELKLEETEWGLIHKTYRPGPDKDTINYREHHFLMPGLSCGGSSQRNLDGATGTPPSGCRWTVPIDDTHTMNVRARFKSVDNKGKWKSDPIIIGWKPIPIVPYREYKESDTPTLGYTIGPVIAEQDAAIMDSIGPIADRENENLGPVIDEGPRMLRKMYLEQIEEVRAGRDPKGTIRDKAKNNLIVIPSYERYVPASQVREGQI